MEYYILTGFLTLLLGPFVGFIPPLLFLLYYPVTKLAFKVLKKDTKQLDDFYLAIPRFFNFTTITNFLINWIIMPPINFLSWLPKAILSLVKFQFNVIKFLIITVPKYIFKVVEFLVDNLIISYIRFFTDYFIKITDWIASGDAGDYFSMVIVNFYEFYFFQWQEILNTVIKNSFGVFKIPPVKAIKLDESAFILKDFF